MRYAIVLNRELEIDVQLKALGRVAVGLAHLAPQPNQALRAFRQADGGFVGLLSDHPFFVRQGERSEDLREAFQAARDAGLVCTAFVLDMKSGEPVDQQTAVRGRSEDDLVFVAVGCWGGPDPVRHTIGRFSPFR